MFDITRERREPAALQYAVESATESIRPLGLNSMTMGEGTWCLPSFHSDVLRSIQPTNTESKDILHAHVAKAAHEQGVPLPEGTFANVHDTLIQQWQQYIKAKLIDPDLLSFHLVFISDKSGLEIELSTASQLTLYKLKDTVYKLNKDSPKLGWWLVDLIQRLGQHIPMYATWDLPHYLYFNQPFSPDEEEMLEEINCFNDQSLTIEQWKEEGSYYWPSDLLAATDGHGWLAGLEGKKVGNKKPEILAREQVQKCLERAKDGFIKNLLTDALALSDHLESEAVMTSQGKFRGEQIYDHESDEGPFDLLGSTCMVVWDKPDILQDAVSHFEQAAMNSGESTEVVHSWRITPNDMEKLPTAIRDLKDFIHTIGLAAHLMRHIPNE